MRSSLNLEGKSFRALNTDFVIFPLAAMLTLLVMAPLMPPQPLLNRDSGFFLYMGQQILKAKIPYLDFWDHKGPLIFYINALGLALAGGNRFGVWLLEYISLLLSAVVGYFLIKKLLGLKPALWGTIAWMYAFAGTIVGGNFTEEYSLPFNFLSISFFYQYLKTRQRIYLLLIGVMLGLNLLLRPNNAGVQVMISIAVFLADVFPGKIAQTILPKKLSEHEAHEGAQTIKKLFLVLAGSLLILAPVCFTLFTQGVLADSVYAAFVFNLKYAGGAAFSKLSVLFFFILASGWPCWFAFAGYALLLMDMKRKVFLLPFEMMLLILIGFPAEILLSTLSGRPYLHYALMFIPYISILNAFLFYYSSRFLKTASHNLKKFSLVNIMIIAFISSFWLNAEFDKRFHAVSSNLSEQSALITYIRDHTTTIDTILVWGVEPSIYFLSQRQSPTRFYFQTPFLVQDFATEKITNEFLSDLRRKRPALIVDANSPELPALIPAASEGARQTPQFLTSFMASLRQYVQENYQKKSVIETWTLYAIDQ